MGLSIDKEKVVKGLEYHLKELSIGKTCYECPYFGDNPCEIQLIANATELLKEQGADKWIPVTERLPEVRNAVLCYSPHHKNIWALSLHEDGEWYYWIPMYQKYNPDFEGPITHWMPLPEHPKEGR